MSVHDKMLTLAISSCTITVILVIMLLSPGITELRDRFQGMMRRVRRKRSQGARHRLAQAPEETDPDPRDTVEDPSGTEVTA